MILVDTSAWVEFLRDTGSALCVRVQNILEGQIATCHPVRMELLAGARDDKQLRDLRSLLARAVTIPTRPADFEEAAALYRSCRRNGATVRKMMDCLIAAQAIRNGSSILHGDDDFNILAIHTPLTVETV
jgi:predicted nucleic acid-binding protein